MQWVDVFWSFAGLIQIVHMYTQYMIYRCIWSTDVNLNRSIFPSLDFLTSSFFPTKWTQNSRHLSETVKIVSVSEFDVKMINNFIAFDFPFRIICVSYQVHRLHPGSEKLYYKSRKENPQKPTQLSSRSHPRHLVGKRTAQKTPS